MSDLEKVLRSIDEQDCEHRSHNVLPWIAKAADRIAELEAMLRATGYNEMQIKAGSAYVEIMGT